MAGSKRNGDSVQNVAPGSTRVLAAVSLFLAQFLAACSPTAAPSNGGDGSGGAAAPAASGGGSAGTPAGGGGAGGTGGAMGGTTGAATGGSAGAGAGGSGSTGGSGGTSLPDAAAAETGGGKPDRISMPGGPGKIVLIAGGGSGGDGTPAVMASTNNPFGAVTDPLNGDVYIAEQSGGRIRRIDDKGIISTVMGGPGGKISLNQPHNLLFQPNSRNLFVADTFAGRVVKMDVATGEAAVLLTGLGRAYCLSFDAAGDNLYVTADGVTIVNLKTMAMSKVNTATPRVIAVDSKSNLYIGGGASLRVADPMGKIMDVMGSGGLAAPKHLSIDLDDNVIITDTESDTIRKYLVATKTVVKIAGGAAGKGTLDGAPEMAGLNRPHGAFMDEKGRIFVADSMNDRVLRIDY
jgi:sugar lactone lactonase YvrE